MLTKQDIKKRYFNKVYANSKEIECLCGCKKKLKDHDHYGRKQKFINGHNGRKYDDPTQYKREWNHRNKESRYKYKVRYGQSLKRKVVELLGGKCTGCGLLYDKTNACVFQLHHSKGKKSFPVNTRTLINYAWKKIIIELKKCTLLCANCHFTLHNERY